MILFIDYIICRSFDLYVSSITKKGEIESTFAPLVVLVINVNIHVVGLTLLPIIFQKSSTVAWQGHDGCGPPQNAKDMDWQSVKTLHFLLSDPRSH